MLVRVAILLLSHLMCFSPLEKPLFCILDSFSTDTSSIEIFGFDLDSFSTDRLIHQAKILCSLSAQHILDRFSIHRGCLLLDWFSAPPQSIKIPLHAFHFSLFCIFFHCVHSILFFFFLQVYSSLFSSFPLYQFSICLESSFLAFYSLWQSCQKGG